MSVTLKPGSIGNWNIGTFKARLRKHIPEQLAAAGGVSALNNQAENRLVTIGATTTELDGEANLTFDGSTLRAVSTTTGKPELVLAGDYNGSGGANLTFATSRAGSISTDGDTLGNITWQDGSSADAGTYAEIYAAADDAAGNKDASVYISCMVNNSAVNIATFGGYSGTTRYGLILPNDSTVGAAKAHSWGTYSDESFKKNIVPIESSLDKVIQLQGVTYDWKTDGTSDIGFIAQNVKKVIPQVVRGDEGEYGLDYGKITAVLAEAVKELNDKIESQKIIISQLTDKIEDLKK